jgi:universal stress protein E
MASKLRHILVAIGELRRPPKGELRKAATLARASGASVELFHAIDEPDPGRGYPETATLAEVKRQRAAIVARSEACLQRFARGPALEGVKVGCLAVWDHPAYDAIVRRALASRADLVVAATQGHRFGGRLLLRNTDWELIRYCPVPLLLVKSPRAYRNPVVLAAVDPFHARAKPAELDQRLLAAAAQVAKLLRGTTHIFHAYMPLAAVDAAPATTAPPVMLPPEVEAAHAEQVERAVDRLARSARIPAVRCHINMGEVSDELRAVTRRTHTALVVMGAVSRSSLARFFIGNTAERVLDKLGCDVLIVKPGGLVAKAARKAWTGTSRGPRPSALPQRPARGTPSSAVTAPRAALPPLF